MYARTVAKEYPIKWQYTNLKVYSVLIILNVFLDDIVYLQTLD